MIELINITKYYKTEKSIIPIFVNASLRVEKNERLGILGPNGSGKSTLIKIISGAERIQGGKINRKMTVSWPLAFGGGFQSGLSGIDNIKFIARIYKKNPKDLIEQIDDFAELGKFLKEPIKNYSSGMRARLAFGASIAIDFDCTLIDEVIAVGDERFQKKCRESLLGNNKNKGFILVSHNAELIREICTTTASIKDCQITKD